MDEGDSLAGEQALSAISGVADSDQAPATSISSPPATVLRPGDLPCTHAKEVCACGKGSVLFSTAPQLPGEDTRVGERSVRGQSE
jgi:hypothetical protein